MRQPRPTPLGFRVSGFRVSTQCNPVPSEALALRSGAGLGVFYKVSDTCSATGDAGAEHHGLSTRPVGRRCRHRRNSHSGRREGCSGGGAGGADSAALAAEDARPGEPRPAAATPVPNPYCSCKLTRKRARPASLLLVFAHSCRRSASWWTGCSAIWWSR